MQSARSRARQNQSSVARAVQPIKGMRLAHLLTLFALVGCDVAEQFDLTPAAAIDYSALKGDASCSGYLKVAHGSAGALQTAGLERCGTQSSTPGHCVDLNEVLGGDAASLSHKGTPALTIVREALGYRLNKCRGQRVCMPDWNLINGGREIGCRGAKGVGVCLSDNLPEVARNPLLLEPDTCPSPLLCVPCVLGGNPTAACVIHEATCPPPTP